MNKFFIAAALTTFALTGQAYADDLSGNSSTGSSEFYDYGTIAKIADGYIEMANGHGYKVIDAAELKGIKVGDKADVWLNNNEAFSIVKG